MEEQENDFMQDMEQLLDEHDYALPEVGDIRTGVVVSITQQGVIVDLGLKRDGIIQPADLDKLPPGEREAIKINDEIPVYILSTESPDSLIVSRHMAILNQDWIRAQALLESGEIFEGEIVGYNRGGALVGFGGLRGFIPASHLTMLSPHLNDRQRQQRLSKIKGEIVPLKVIEVDQHRRRLVLSQRDAEKVWKEARRKELMETINIGDVILGRVSGWRDFGAFVDLGGVDGLVHVSELAWYRVEHPRQVVQIGDEVEVYVLRIDSDRQRISLSRKKLLPNPWSLVEENYAVGQLVEGKIIRIVDYGAFVELEPGVEGLLHVSQVSRSNINDPREVVNEGEVHLLRVISVDIGRERIGLSLKAVRAQEQIEWMTERELAAAAQAATSSEKEITETIDAPEAVTEAEVLEGEAETAEPEAEAAEVSEAEVEAPEAEVPEPEAEAAEVSEAEVEAPEAEVPEPEAEASETEEAETAEPEAEAAEVSEADVEAPEAEVPEPEAKTSETEEAETTEPEAEAPETEETETVEPEAEASETEEAETVEPEAKTSETEEAETTEPEAEAPETEETETVEPEAEASETEEAETVEPEAKTSETEEAETTEPEAEAPETEETETVEPEAEASETEEAETTEPEADTAATETPPFSEQVNESVPEPDADEPEITVNDPTAADESDTLSAEQSSGDEDSPAA